MHINNKPLLIISANHPKAFINFQRSALRSGVDYLYDPGMSLTWIKDQDLKSGVLGCKYFVGNDYEVAMITKRIKMNVSDLVKKGVNVITTLGEEGVRYESSSENIIVKGVKLKKVMDPTGAGDAWRGGFIGAITSGWNIKDALKLGNVMASFAVEKYGTVKHSPSNTTIEKRIKGL
jgi:adenosine kinase